MRTGSFYMNMKGKIFPAVLAKLADQLACQLVIPNFK